MSTTSDIKAVLFDLDGTLLDTLTDLAESMNAVLSGLGFPAHPRDAYRHFVGDGLEILASRVLPEANRTQAMIERCAAGMRDEYQGRWAAKTKPYEGIAELLDALTSRGLRLNILSNKPDDFTRLMVNHFLSAWHWELVRGAQAATPKKPKPDGALAIAGQLGLAPHHFLYLGDTNTDMQTAIAADMMPIGVLWGFRSKTELAEAGAQAVLHHPLDLLKLI